MLRGGLSVTARAIVTRLLKNDDDEHSHNAGSPTRAPTISPISTEGLSGTTAQPWYDSSAFIVFCVLLGAFLLVGAGLKFWWMTQSNKGRESETEGRGGISSGIGKTKFVENGSSQYQYAAAESASLLGNNKANSTTLAPPALNVKKPEAFSISEPPKFCTGDLQDCEEPTLMRKFNAIMSSGIVISLHTTKGPKPILLSADSDEVRWQAVKTAQKRYKLALKDITFVTAGKTTSNFSRARMADDRLCFSLLTNKTTLDLEASSTLERDCLWRGFKVAVEKSKFVNA